MHYGISEVEDICSQLC